MNSAEALNYLEILKSVNHLSKAKLSGASYVRELRKGEHLFFDKEECTAVYIVLSGMVCIYKTNQQNDKKVIFVFNEGKFINEEILNGLPVSSNCEALENATVLCLPKSILLEVMQEDFELTKVVLCALSLKARRMYRQLKNASGTVRMDKKLAAKLWKLSLDYGAPCREGVYIDLDLSVTFLAEMLGSKRETISRQLKILSEHQLISVKNNRYIVLDQDKLSQYFKSP